MRSLPARQNFPALAQAHARCFSLPPSTLLPPISQIQDLRTGEGQGGVCLKATSTKLFHSCVSHWTVWSICLSPVRSAPGNKLRRAWDSAWWTCLGCSGRSPLHTSLLLLPSSTALAPLPWFVFVPAKFTSQDRSVQCCGAGHQR